MEADEKRSNAEQLAALLANGGHGLITQALKDMPYAEYLRTEHWHAVRSKALKRAGYKCEIERRHEGRLHVHHNNYECRGEEKDTDVNVLCDTCHHTWHETGMLQFRQHMRNSA